MPLFKVMKRKASGINMVEGILLLNSTVASNGILSMIPLSMPFLVTNCGRDSNLPGC